jgi:hypothetical protein
MEASDAQAALGAVAALAHFERKGIDVKAVLDAYEATKNYYWQVLAWEARTSEYPEELNDEVWELADVAELAWVAAIDAAGCPSGLIGYAAEAAGGAVCMSSI